jgi:hypothetical protein
LVICPSGNQIEPVQQITDSGMVGKGAVRGATILCRKELVGTLALESYSSIAGANVKRSSVKGQVPVLSRRAAQ